MSLEAYCYLFSQQLRQIFGCRVQKISLDAGFSCPNRDGLLDTAGCAFCNNEAFSPVTRLPRQSLIQQLDAGIQGAKKKYNARKFIAYFQTYTNTYGPVDLLKERYDVIKQVDDIVGLSVSTRPDCIDPDKLDLLESYSSDYVVWVEYGLQSIHDASLQNMNRHHTYADFIRAVELTSSRNLRICVHLILGFPGETTADMLATADALAQLPIDALKIHVFHVLTNTRSEHDYASGRIVLSSMHEYAAMLVSFLERTPATICIQRMTADAHRPYLIAPLWLESKQAVLSAIEREFSERKSYQGRTYRERSLR
ncbi:TIGR01212 family radical SAM protein [bacterium]|nr:TIGR01212 family radical SAM protein [bacterium]